MKRWGAFSVLFIAGCFRAGFDGGAGRDAGDSDAPGPTDGVLSERPSSEGSIIDGSIIDSPLPEGPIPLDGHHPGDPTGALVPLYVDPPHTAWTLLSQAKMAHPKLPVVAVVNVKSGPGASSKSQYEMGIAALSLSGVTVIGFVKTNYGKRDLALVKQDIDRWNSFYASHGLTGVFLSQQATDVASLSYYQDLSSYAKGKGLSLVVGDPGTDPDKSYVGVMDTMVIYQGKGLPAISTLGGWHTQHPKKRFAILAYNVAQLDKGFVASARKYVGYIYITDDGAGVDDPWDSLSSTLDDLLAELDK